MGRNLSVGMLGIAAVCSGCMASSQSCVESVPEWNPPKTVVAKEIVDAGRFLLKHGLGDPRGGKLGIAKVRMSGSWSQEAYDAKVLGWIKEEGGKKAVVDLTGIAYPVVAVVKEIKAEDAVEEALKHEAKGAIRYQGPLSRLQPFFAERAAQSSVQFPEMLSDQAVILFLIHGETALAEKLFAKRRHPDFENGRETSKPGLGRYTEYSILSAFVSNYWVEAVHAHMRGDDELAYRMAKTLADNAEAYEKYASTLQTAAVSMPDPVTGEKKAFPYIQPAKDLEEDSARRVQEGPKKVDMASLAKLSQKERIAKLIDWLDQVSARQWGQPGGVNLADDRIVQALIKEGNAAGDALLDCMERDRRLTRSVSFGRDFFPGRNLLTVKSAAFAAFCGITQVDAYGINMRRQPTVAELREIWAKYKNVSPAERWLSVLQDDKSSHQQWVAAAQWLAEPKDVEHKGGGWVTLPKTDGGKPVSPPKFTDLPPAKKAELAKVLEARARLIEKQNTSPSSLRYHEHQMALEIAVALFAVDAKRAVPLLSELIRLAVNDSAGGRGGGIAQNMQNAVIQACGCLLEAKAPKAEELYLGILKSFPVDTFGNPRILVPFDKMDPAKADKLVKDVLTAKGSSFNLESNIASGRLFFVRSLIESPLLAFPSFRNRLSSLLSRKEAVGKVVVRDGSRSVSIIGDSGWETGAPVIDPNDLQGAVHRTCRLGDFLAVQLSSRTGAPKFGVYWSNSRKDAAIKDLQEYLKGHWQKILGDLRKMHRF